MFFLYFRNHFATISAESEYYRVCGGGRLLTDALLPASTMETDSLNRNFNFLKKNFLSHRCFFFHAEIRTFVWKQILYLFLTKKIMIFKKKKLNKACYHDRGFFSMIGFFFSTCFSLWRKKFIFFIFFYKNIKKYKKYKFFLQRLKHVEKKNPIMEKKQN